MINFLEYIKLKILHNKKLRNSHNHNKKKINVTPMFSIKVKYIFVSSVLLFTSALVASIFLYSKFIDGKAYEEGQITLKLKQARESQNRHHPAMKDIVYTGRFRDFRPAVEPVRKPNKTWSPEEVDKYWVNIEYIGLEDVGIDNFNMLVDYFEKAGR